MSLSKFLLAKWFFLGFGLGILYIYISTPKPKIIIKHPTPDNAGKVVYHDKEQNCYKYMAEEIKCPDDPKMALNHPLVLSNE
jgi:hypothetical protein